jgi:hypothetical protein
MKPRIRRYVHVVIASLEHDIKYVHPTYMYIEDVRSAEHYAQVSNNTFLCVTIVVPRSRCCPPDPKSLSAPIRSESPQL